MLEKFVKDFLPWVGPHTGAAKECEEEEAADTTCYELTVTPIPHPPVLFGGRRQRKSGEKLGLGRREGWAEDDFRFVFVSHNPTQFVRQ